MPNGKMIVYPAITSQTPPFYFTGNSYTTYMKEEVGSYRVVIGNQTATFEQETDPSVLRLA